MNVGKLRKALYLLDMARGRPNFYKRDTLLKRERDVKLAAYNLIKGDLVQDDGMYLASGKEHVYFGEAEKVQSSSSLRERDE